jgi:HK97 gp10 family phage protein
MASRLEFTPDMLAQLQAISDQYVEDTVLPKIAAKAKRIVPYDSGTLHDNIEPVVNSDGMFVVANTEYAEFVELGTSKMAAQPYLRPAMTTALGE